METGPMDDVGHEGVAGDQLAAGEGDCEGSEVDAVAWAAAALREVASEHRFEALLALSLDGVALARERRAGRELAQQLEQR
jgi:hypothetical protein